MLISALLIRIIVIAAVCTGLAVVGRAASPKWRPAPPPGSEDQRARKGANPLLIFGFVLGSLFLLVVGWLVAFYGIWWMACRGGGSC